MSSAGSAIVPAAPDLALIDVWDVATFDADLMARLESHGGMIADYMTTNRHQWLERERSDHTRPYPENPHAGDYLRFVDELHLHIGSRTIRAWHYTRQTDAEVTRLVAEGIHLSDLVAIRRRLDAQVAAGVFSTQVADALFGASPFQSEQRASRSGKFWMTSHPIDIDDGGVNLLLENWGGEGAYFWLRDEALERLVASIGRPRVIEVAAPLAATRHQHSAAEAMVAAYGRSRGLRWETKMFDLYVTQPLPPQAVLAVHSRGEPAFAAIGASYPERFIPPTSDRY